MRRRLTFLGAAAVLAAAALLLGGAVRGGGAPQAHAAVPAVLPGASAAQRVAELQARLHYNPTDPAAWGQLGIAYEQRARETGDSTYYSKAGGSLERAIRLRPHDLVATSGLGSLALSRHRFREALAIGRRAVELSPSTARSYGIVGDALVELGHYRPAFRALRARIDDSEVRVP